MTNVTILVHNRPRLTKQALNSLIATPDCNITVLDDRSDEETQEIVNGYTAISYAVRNEQPMGTGALRNMVIKASESHYGRGEYLYLSDNDVKAHAGWLDTLATCYEVAWQYGYKVIGAYNHPYHQHGDRLNVFAPQGHNNSYSHVHEVKALALQSMLMRWEIWDLYGPFVETPPGRVCMGEDVEFGWKISKDGGKLGVVDPPLLVNTGITNSFGEKIPGWELVKAQAPAGVLVE
jgi:GT2 family glycosyltransferase